MGAVQVIREEASVLRPYSWCRPAGFGEGHISA